MGRRTKTTLPTHSVLLKPKTQNPKTEKKKVEKIRAKQQLYFNKNAKDMAELKPGESVRVQLDPGKNVWKKGRVLKQVKKRSYEIDVHGNTYRRNRVHIRKNNDDAASESNNEVPFSPLSSSHKEQQGADAPLSPSRRGASRNDPPVIKTPRRSERQKAHFVPYEHIP